MSLAALTFADGLTVIVKAKPAKATAQKGPTEGDEKAMKKRR